MGIDSEIRSYMAGMFTKHEKLARTFIWCTTDYPQEPRPNNDIDDNLTGVRTGVSKDINLKNLNFKEKTEPVIERRMTTKNTKN